MPHQTEPSANNALGRLLQRMLPGCEVRTEHTRVIDGNPGLQPDILITAAGRSPVVIEAEYDPAASVEAEAKSRLGLEVAARPIEAAIALRYPAAVGAAADLDAALDAARLSYAVFTQERKECRRFPETGWLHGSVEDLADLNRLVSVPHSAVDKAAIELEAGIDRAATILEEAAKLRPATGFAIAGLLGMTNVRQTWRMAGAIIANALIFHERLAGMHRGIGQLEVLRNQPHTDLKRATLAAWSKILDINYWPIFGVARDIVSQLESSDAAVILHRLCGTATWVRSSGVDNTHDLTGRVFQRLIADRKYLATFYTLPPSAALLARLAVAKLQGVDWSDAEAIGKLRVADFACGTGALLSAVYEQIAARHERAGSDAAALHAVMMEEVLYGFDVMPSAIHITGSTLAGMQPAGKFRNSRLYPLNYLRQRDGTVKIGSLELLRSSGTFTMFNLSDPERRTGSTGEETATQLPAEIPKQSVDLVIMNPPFTSNTKHRDAHDGVVNAAFAAFDASEADQSAMAGRLKQRAAGSCYHGHAGLASAFAALADEKLRPSGVIALVLPFTAINGSSWSKFRKMIAKHYTDITVVSIAGVDTELSFSSDTDIGECLVVARRVTQQVHPARRGQFISLAGKPESFMQALELSKGIVSSAAIRRLEDGPYGGIPIYCGDEPTGEVLDAPIDTPDNGWGAARILDASVAQTAHALAAGKLWLPAEPKAREMSIAPLSQVGRRGLDSQMFISQAHNGPFVKAKSSPTATYPSLWRHKARNETRMICVPDSQFLVRSGMEGEAAEAWSTASRAHLSRGFRFNSQPLSAAFTEQKSLGGRAWPNAKFSDERFDYAFLVWSNSTLGLLCYWWHSNRQVAGRGDITVHSAESLPILDFRNLGDSQLTTAEAIFEEFREKDLKPAFLADADPNRALLDRYVICDLLGFDQTVYEGVRRLAAKLCAEPSVHGGKQRPNDALMAI